MKQDVLRNRKVLVLGLGDTGLSMVRWLVRQGAHVRVADSRDCPPHAAELARELPEVPVTTGPLANAPFAGADVIAISPGVDRREPPVARALERGVPVVGDVELFAQGLERVLQFDSAEPAPRLVAITGSNGKSTVTAMTGELCRAAGRRVVVAGNIGLPVLDVLTGIEDGAAMPDIFVLELSSFQLESTSSLRATASAMLNICEDHLDRYDGLGDYAAAKARIFSGAAVQVLNRDDAWSMEMARPGMEQVSFGLGEPAGDRQWGVLTAGESVLARGDLPLMPVRELPLPGMHNAANALAAFALARAVGTTDRALVEGMRRFRGLPHRMQQVAAAGGITFINDSKGTNVGATVAALRGSTARCVLIAGGDGKGQDFSPLAPAVAEHARAVILIGRDAPLLEAALCNSGVALVRACGMREAVCLAQAAACPGDVVLLSPACASYDMFRSYVHRGETYAAAVLELVGGEPITRSRPAHFQVSGR